MCKTPVMRTLRITLNHLRLQFCNHTRVCIFSKRNGADNKMYVCA